MSFVDLEAVAEAFNVDFVFRIPFGDIGPHLGANILT